MVTCFRCQHRSPRLYEESADGIWNDLNCRCGTVRRPEVIALAPSRPKFGLHSIWELRAEPSRVTTSSHCEPLVWTLRACSATISCSKLVHSFTSCVYEAVLVRSVLEEPRRSAKCRAAVKAQTLPALCTPTIFMISFFKPVSRCFCLRAAITGGFVCEHASVIACSAPGADPHYRRFSDSLRRKFLD